MTDAKKKWSRRKEARPQEILDAAMDMFVEKGFAGTKLSDVATRAGVAKGTLYLYFETKEDLFRETAREALLQHLGQVEAKAGNLSGAIADLVPFLLLRAAGSIKDGRIPKLVRMVIAESLVFPDLARIWHDEVISRVLPMFAQRIGEAQTRGEIRPGDPKLIVISIMAPMFMAMLAHEVFGIETPFAPDLDALARQHSEVILRGIMAIEER